MVTLSKTKIVTAAVIVENGKVLLARRLKNDVQGGLWEFPGGKVEPAETLEDALVREIKEELGISIRVEKPFTFSVWNYQKENILLLFFNASVLQGDPVPIQCAEVKWFNSLELEQLKNISPADKKVLIDIKKLLS